MLLKLRLDLGKLSKTWITLVLRAAVHGLAQLSYTMKHPDFLVQLEETNRKNCSIAGVQGVLSQIETIVSLNYMWHYLSHHYLTLNHKISDL